jgi:hypothetical protein
MNSLAFPRYAKRVLMALAAVASIALAASCGSSSSITKPNPVGFSNSDMSGTYTFSTAGSDVNQFFVTTAGTLVADGNGKVTGGTMDVVDSDASIGASGPLSITGTYSVSSDGRGQIQVNSSFGTLTYAFVLTSGSHGLITEFDGSATGSGSIDLQTSVPTLAQLAGAYAFSLGGIDSNFNALGTVGSFTLNSSGTITAGVEDFNDSGSPVAAVAITGNATAGTGTGPATITFDTTFGTFVYDVYAIDSTHLKFIETDFSTAVLSGDVFSQTGATIPTGQLAFTMSGGVSVPVAVGGVLTSDASGNFSAGLEDVNSNGSISSTPLAFSGSASAGGSVGGRKLVALTNFIPATTVVIYPSSGGLLMMELDPLNVTLGIAYPQSSVTFGGASQNYGLNLGAFNTDGGFEEDDIAQFTTTSTSLSGAVDINDDGSVARGRALTGTYTAADSNGRGTAMTTVGGNSFVSFNYYVVDSSTVLILETDTNQIGTGIVELQSASTAGVRAQSRMSLTHPSVGSHGGALRHK